MLVPSEENEVESRGGRRRGQGAAWRGASANGGMEGCARVCVCVCVYVRRKFWVSLGVCRACAFEERGGGEVVIL